MRVEQLTYAIGVELTSIEVAAAIRDDGLLLRCHDTHGCAGARREERRMSHPIEVGVADELKPGQRKLAFIDGRSIVLFNIDGTIHAIDNSCPHNGASLASGQLEGCVLRCPAHGLRFDLRTGCMPGAGGLSLTTFAVRIVDGKLLLSLAGKDATPAHAPASAAT